MHIMKTLQKLIDITQGVPDPDVQRVRKQAEEAIQAGDPVFVTVEGGAVTSVCDQYGDIIGTARVIDFDVLAISDACPVCQTKGIFTETRERDQPVCPACGYAPHLDNALESAVKLWKAESHD